MPTILARLGSLLLLLAGAHVEAAHAGTLSSAGSANPVALAVRAGLPESLLPMPSISPSSSDPFYESGLPDRAIEENVEEEDFKGCQVGSLSDLNLPDRAVFSDVATGCPARSHLVALRTTCLRC
jgi:hypothetical protein